MAHDVFISHSAKDKTTADAVCAMLEAEGIRCWIAPRDVTPGMEWGAAIITAIKQARVMVLVFTASANASQQIRKEVERAVHHDVAILPFRVENIVPDESLEYFIGNVHWLDALTPPLEAHLKSLARTIKTLTAAPGLEKSEAADAPVPGPGSTPKPPGPVSGSASSPQFRSSRVQPWMWFAGAGALLLLTAILLVVHFTSRPPVPGPTPPPVISSQTPSPAVPQTGPAPAPAAPSAVTEPPHQPRTGRAPANTPANPSPPRSNPQSDEQRAGELMQAKNYTAALPLAQSACSGGDMAGCNMLGLLYRNGWGVAQNYAQARTLFQEACDGGEVSGCGNLGFLYVKGFGVPQNIPKGTALLQRACNAGRPWSCNQLKLLQR